MRVLALMRHGEPQPPPLQRSIHDDRDRRLTELGRRQAEAARGWLEGLDPVAVLCSGAPRCVETARIAGAPLQARVVPDLAGLRLGLWEQRPLAAVGPDVVRMVRGEIPAPEGAETPAELLARATRALHAALPETGNVLVVAHRLTNALLLGEALGIAPADCLRIPQDYASVSLLSLDDARDQVLAVNVSPADPLRGGRDDVGDL
jgi:broad specificity phosphatase PhoE